MKAAGTELSKLATMILDTLGSYKIDKLKKQISKCDGLNSVFSVLLT